MVDLLGCCHRMQKPESYGEILFMWGGNLGRFAGTTKKCGNSWCVEYGTPGSGKIITFWPGVCALRLRKAEARLVEQTRDTQ
jgi:hypothetical protein